MNIKLREIIWEITPKCNKNCDYCGSKSILKENPLDQSKLFEIAIQISKYNINEVTLSGGRTFYVE